MDEARRPAVLRLVAGIHAARLEIAADRAGRDLAIGVLAGKPDLDVVGLARREAHVAGAERDGAEGQIETLQHLLGAARHALMFVRRLLRRGDRDELDLGELMLADHAARVAARRARLGAEARRPGREAHAAAPIPSVIASRTRLVSETSAVGMSHRPCVV